MLETARITPLLVNSRVVVFLCIVFGRGLVALVLSALFSLLLRYLLSRVPRPLPLVSFILLLMLF